MADGLKMEYEMERRLRLTPKVFGLSNWKIGFGLT